MWSKFVTLVKKSVSTTDTSSCKCSAEQTARVDLLLQPERSGGGS